MADVASQAGDADSSLTRGLTPDFKGSINASIPLYFTLYMFNIHVCKVLVL